jgi:hypothetical protein
MEILGINLAVMAAFKLGLTCAEEYANLIADIDICLKTNQAGIKI